MDDRSKAGQRGLAWLRCLRTNCGFTSGSHEVDSAMPLALDIDRDALVSFCRRNRVAKLELFGSRARGTARPESDVDLLITFADGYTPGLEFFGMADELTGILGRHVDLLTRPSVEGDRNPYFKQSVLSVVEQLYAA